MAKFVYIYNGQTVDFWDAKGKTVVSSTASQADLAYLHSAGCAGISKQELPEKPKKGE